MAGTGAKVIEPAREIPIAGEFDVLICGGGTAGFPAATAAGRLAREHGLKVGLIERYGFMGGVPAYCLMPAWHRMKSCNSGLLNEFASRMEKLGPGPTTSKSEHTEPEYVKKLAIDLVTEAGVDVHLHTFAVSTLMEGNHVTGVITESKSGRRAFLAKCIIDTTGDGDVAAFAGADYLKGNDGVTQGMTLRMRVGNVDFNAYCDWLEANPQHTKPYVRKEFLAGIRAKAARGEEFFLPADLAEVLQAHPGEDDLPLESYFNGSSIRPGEFSINGTRLFGVDGTREEDLTRAEISCRKQAYALWRFVSRHVPGFTESRLIETASQIGVRETRCIIGDYILTEDDCRAGRNFEDTVVRNPVGFDLHDKKYKLEELPELVGVPYRCFLPKGLENILVAGRCLSSDHVANSTIRRMMTAFQSGQVAGIAAVLSQVRHETPRQLPFPALKTAMEAQGMEI